MAKSTLVATCAQGVEVTLPSADKLTDIITDAGSWISFLKMTLGGPAARMKVRHQTGKVEYLTVSRQE